MSKGKRYTEYGCIDCLRMAYRRMDTALGHLHQAALRGAEAELIERLQAVQDDIAGLIRDLRATK